MTTTASTSKTLTAPPSSNTIPSARAWAFSRLAVAGLGIAALGTQLVYEIQKASARPEPYARDIPTVVGDFWSTYTYLTSALMSLVLILSAITALRRKAEPLWLSITVTAVAANMFYVGAFFNIVLRWSMPDDAIAWISESLHVVLPLYALADAMLGTHRRVPLAAMWSAALLPIGWTIVTQIRGPLVIDRTTGEPGWYPYDFANPALVPGGTLGVTAICIILTGIITTIGFLIAIFVRWTQKRR